MVECRVEFDYDAQQADELTIRPGDIIKNVDQQDGGWWEGELNGKRGMFPDNFVKIIKSETKKSTKNKGNDATKSYNTTDDFKMAASSEVTGDVAVKSGHVKELKHVLSKQVSLQGTQKKDGKKKKLARVRAIQTYAAEEDDELSFEVGDIIEVTEKDGENWWRGHMVNKDNTGSFPVKYTEPVDDDEHDYAAEVTEIQPKKVKGVGLGDIFKNEPIKLRPTGRKDEKAAPKASSSSSSPPDDVAPVPPKPIKPHSLRFARDRVAEYAKVLFSYDAVNDDELSLKEGDQVLILDKDIEDDGWWKGEIGGKQGVFPNNFVQLIEPKPKRPTAAPKKIADRPLPLEPKQDKVTTPKDERPPPLPGKKPDMPPPPVGKKPSKTSSGKEEKTTPTEEFDAVESAVPLKNLNVNRPKGPSKRPPSTNAVKSEVNGEEGGYDPPWSSDPNVILNAVRNKEEPPRQKPPPVPPPAPSRPNNEASLEPSLNNKFVEELRAEIRDLKATTVSKEVHDDLKNEVQELREQLHLMRRQFEKRIVALMNEIDEEKKMRFQNQVEMERVKKLAMTKMEDTDS